MYCKSCGKEINSSSTFCSNCGSPINNEAEITNTTNPMSDDSPIPKKKTSLFRKLIYVAIAIILVMAFIKSLDPYGNILNIDTMREAYSYSQEAICKDVLIDPTSSEFPKFEPDFVTQISEKHTYDGIEYDVYTVTAYVDSNNAFGAKFRMNYTVEIGFPVDSSIDSIYYNIVSTDP